MQAHQINELLQSSELSSILEADVLSRLAKICRIKEYKKDVKIYCKNERVTNFIMLISGECELIDSNKKTIRTLKKDDFFGLVSLLSNSKKNYDLVSKCDVISLELNKSDLDNLSKFYPHIKDKLLDIINIKLFNPQINEAIKNIAQDIDEKTMGELKKDISWKTLNDSEILFKEGDPGDSCYIIMSGRVQAIKNYDQKNEIILGELNRGDIIGDMALITGEKRSATIKASKLTRLIYFSKDTFNSVMYNNPKALMEVSKALINRLKYSSSNDKSNNLVIGVISLMSDSDTNNFLDFFIRNIKKFGSINVIDEKNTSANEDLFNLEILIENIISKTNFLILKSNDLNNTEWKSNILQYSDKVLIIGNQPDLKNLSNEEQIIFNNYQDIDLKKLSLVINHAGDTKIPRDTKIIKSIRKDIKTFHLKEISALDVGRIVRFITGNTIGLVLGGGGAKGFAHLGIYKAMNELNIPIDVIGGTSAGSIIAAQIALGLEIDEIIRLNKSVNKLKMFKEYGFPYISLIKSKKIEQAAKLVGNNRDIEDMWVPFFAPATDLSNSKLKLFESGPIWEAIRSSGALPGIVVPHFKDNSALVDGGVLNNLPVDIMRKKHGGNIICSSCSKDDSNAINLDSIPNQFRLFLEKIFKKESFKKKYNHIPTIPELILKMSVVSSSQLTQENIKLSNLYLELPVENYGLTDFKDKAMLNMIEIGYQYSLNRLKEYKQDVII